MGRTHGKWLKQNDISDMETTFQSYDSTGEELEINFLRVPNRLPDLSAEHSGEFQSHVLKPSSIIYCLRFLPSADSLYLSCANLLASTECCHQEFSICHFHTDCQIGLLCFSFFPPCIVVNQLLSLKSKFMNTPSFEVHHQTLVSFVGKMY